MSLTGEAQIFRITISGRYKCIGKARARLLCWTTVSSTNNLDVVNQKSGDGLVPLTVTWPAACRCEKCTKAQADLRDLRDRIEKTKIKYFVLMIPSGSNTSRYFTYADSLKLDTEVFVWSNREARPSAPIATMAAPSHLLVSTEGLVANKWAGIPAKF